jgi:hypothetical protein
VIPLSFSGPSYNYVILASYSGAITMGSAVYSTGDSITIKFGTDGSDTDSGFYIGYEEGSVGKISIIFQASYNCCAINKR